MDWGNDSLVLLRISLAALLGGIVGLERELAEKPAGLRTHMLVAASAALLIALGNLLVGQFNFPDNMQSDPIRILEAIIVGISFLGAGTIFRGEGEERVEGLTTGASILFTAGIGTSVALGQILLALGATALILLINYGLRFVETWLKTKGRSKAGS